jgi:hypothetical protein
MWLALSIPAQAAPGEKTLTGVAIGAGAGAIVAGPPGAIVGGLVGAVIGGPRISNRRVCWRDSNRVRHCRWQ